MKPTLLAVLACATIAASGAAVACDDMKMTNDGDGYGASRAPEVQAAVADKAQAPLTVKQKAPVKQKTAGKPIPQGTAVARTGG